MIPSDSSSIEALVWSSPEAGGCRELKITGVMQAKGSQEAPHQKERIMTGIMTSRESTESKHGGWRKARQGMWLRGGWVVPMFVFKKHSLPQTVQWESISAPGRERTWLTVIRHSLRHREPEETSHYYTMYVYRRTLRSGHNPDKMPCFTWLYTLYNFFLSLSQVWIVCLKQMN